MQSHIIDLVTYEPLNDTYRRCVKHMVIAVQKKYASLLMISMCKRGGVNEKACVSAMLSGVITNTDSYSRLQLSGLQCNLDNLHHCYFTNTTVNIIQNSKET